MVALKFGLQSPEQKMKQEFQIMRQAKHPFVLGVLDFISKADVGPSTGKHVRKWGAALALPAASEDLGLFLRKQGALPGNLAQAWAGQLAQATTKGRGKERGQRTLCQSRVHSSSIPRHAGMAGPKHVCPSARGGGKCATFTQTYMPSQSTHIWEWLWDSEARGAQPFPCPRQPPRPWRTSTP